MMMAIAAPLFDADGNIVLRRLAADPAGGVERRVSRTRTLDGGVAISDQGSSTADRVLNVVVTGLTQAEHDQLKRLAGTYSLLLFSVRDGVFQGAIASIDYDRGESRLRILFKSRISG